MNTFFFFATIRFSDSESKFLRIYSGSAVYEYTVIENDYSMGGGVVMRVTLNIRNRRKNEYTWIGRWYII